jgi:hypothetical protein
MEAKEARTTGSHSRRWVLGMTSMTGHSHFCGRGALLLHIKTIMGK